MVHRRRSPLARLAVNQVLKNDMANQTYKRYLVLVCTALALAFPAAAQDLPPEVQRLRSLIEQATDPLDAMDDLPALAIDAGPTAIPVLREVLARDQGHRGELAAAGLAYIGGDTAVEVLLQHYRARKDLTTKSLLATAMASTKLTAENRAFLEECLKGEHFGTEWMPIVSSALSLGVLRASESREALERTAKKTPGSIASGAAEEALRWMAQGHWKLEIQPTVKVEPAIGAVLRNGVPRTDEAERFFDPERHLYWSHRNATWTIEETSEDGDVPSMSFRIHLSPDETRALVSVGITFGPLNGIGYDYVLRKEGNEWVVQGVFFTWIS